MDNITIYENDIPEQIYKLLNSCKTIAMDIETTGLDYEKDTISLIQIYCKSYPAFLIKVTKQKPDNISSLLTNPAITKIFHFAVFDLSFLYSKWEINARNIVCTKIASRLLDPNNRFDHGLKSVLKRKLDVNIDKTEQKSDWSLSSLKPEQIQYAINDVLYLESLFKVLKNELIEKSLYDIARKCFEHIPVRVFLDRNGYKDLYLHH